MNIIDHNKVYMKVSMKYCIIKTFIFCCGVLFRFDKLYTKRGNVKTQVLIIGGGATGTGIARDLALRGVECLLVEKNDINAGASGANHGLLHSGARYVATDGEAAMECREEGKIIKKNAPNCVEETGGLFVAVEGDNKDYVNNFSGMCQKYGIPCKEIDIKQARKLEPVLSDKLISAFYVDDATIDPFMLSLENISHARALGSKLLRYTAVDGFTISDDMIVEVKLHNTKTGEKTIVEAEQVINAAGGWAADVTSLAGLKINMIYSKGTLLITQNRIAQRVINRLRQASDADILVPGGTVSIIGTTSISVDSPEGIYPTMAEVDNIIKEGKAMVPALETTRYMRAFCGVRPLVSSGDGDGRSVTRGYALIDHEEEGIKNFTSITSGKLTTYRLMAEKTSDLVCKKLNVSNPCKTKTEPLPITHEGQWAGPATAPKKWIVNNNPEDILLCECEMVSKSVIGDIISAIKEQKAIPTIKDVGMRSRVGKGPCQGAFCGIRIAAYMYDCDNLSGDTGVNDIKEFINARWRGQRQLLADTQLVQAELQEAIQCGLYSLDISQAHSAFT